MNHTIIGVDLGGTKIKAGRIKGDVIEETKTQLISSQGNENQVLQEVIATIETLFDKAVSGIGIGVPSIVDVEKGIVYDVQNIPSWEEVHLKQHLEKHFGVPVYINNDANCFAVGEKYFGEGKGYENMMGLIIGTGMAAGIIIQNKLYNGFNCGAGEFGMLPYLDYHYEHYCSGQYFENTHSTTGEKLFNRATSGEKEALEIFAQYGLHFGNAIIAILYALDPEIIILGGSVSKSYDFFKDALWKRLQIFAYRPVVSRLTIKVSSNPDIPLLGSAALYYDAMA